MTVKDRFGARSRRRAVETALLLVIGAAGPLAYALGHPAYSTGDEMAHVDYAYHLWSGRFPDFLEGVMIRTDVGTTPSVQWVSHHPPLFYAALAPVVGPLLDAGHPVVAVMLARGVLVALAALSVLAVRWAARGAFPASQYTATVAALIYALSSWFPRQGGSVYNDLPAVLALTLAAGFLFRALRDPFVPRHVAGLTLFSVLGASVRFSTILLVVGLLSALLVHRAMVARAGRRGLVECAVVVTAVVAATGWWWRRNLELTGNLQGSRAEYWIEERGWRARSFEEVVTSDFWRVMLQQFFSTTFMRPSEPWHLPAWIGIVVLLGLPLVLGLGALMSDRWQGRRQPGDETELLVMLVLVGLMVTVVATQVAYTMSSGSPGARYFFALVPWAAMSMAYAMTRWHWSVGLLVGWVGLRLVALALEVESTIGRQLRGPQAAFYPTLSWAAYGVVVLSAVLLLALMVTSWSRRTEPHGGRSTPPDGASVQ